MSKLLLALALIFVVKVPAYGALPDELTSDPRIVGERTVIDGHLVEYPPIPPEIAAMLPPGIILASIDGETSRWYAFGRLTPITINFRNTRYKALAFDPSQATGNYPGVVSVTIGTNGLALTGTNSQPTLDIGPSITLSGGSTAVTLSSATGSTISSAGTGGTNPGVIIEDTGTPGAQAFLLKADNAPSGKLFELRVGANSQFTVDASGNTKAFGTLTALGNIAGTSNGSIVEATPTINSTNTEAEVLPVYTAGGAITAASLHAVIGTCAFTVATGTSCTNSAWTGSAVFASNTAYACTASWQNSTTPNIVSISAKSATQMTITISTAVTQTANYVCVGT